MLQRQGQVVTYFNKLHGSIDIDMKTQPEEMKKKCSLFSNFKRYLSNKREVEGHHQTFVKKWMQTDQAKLFRMSSEIIQVNFKDEAKVLLYSDD